MPQSSQTAGTMTVRVCDRGSGRDYVGVRIRTVTVSDRCPSCGGPRGVDTIRNHNFHEDGDWLSVDRWTNPCGHVDMYDAVLREARDMEIIKAAGANNAEWDDETWAAWWRHCERVHADAPNAIAAREGGAS